MQDTGSECAVEIRDLGSVDEGLERQAPVIRKFVADDADVDVRAGIGDVPVDAHAKDLGSVRKIEGRPVRAGPEEIAEAE